MIDTFPLSAPPPALSKAHFAAPPPSTCSGLRARRQPLRCQGDLFTPAWVRGESVEKEGYCSLCETDDGESEVANG